MEERNRIANGSNIIECSSLSYPFNAFPSKSSHKVQCVGGQVVGYSLINLVNSGAHREATVGVPHHLHRGILEPSFEADFSESSPRERILLSSGAVVDFDLLVGPVRCAHLATMFEQG